MSILTLLTTTDVHSTTFSTDNPLIPNYKGQLTGGIGKRQTLLNQYRNNINNGRVLLLDNGDFYPGSIFSDKYKGESDIAIMNFMKYDAISIGNHDPDDGFDNLLQQLTKLHDIPVLCSNIVDPKDDKLFFERYKIFEIDGFKIGIFSIFGSHAYQYTIPEFRQQAKHLSPIDEFRKVGTELRSLCDLVICLSHSDPSEDQIFRTESIVDILITGHFHHLYKKEAEIIPNNLNNSVHGTIWHQGPSHGSGFGVFKLSLSRTENGEFQFELLESGVALADESIPDDPEIMNYFQPFIQPLHRELYECIATCHVDYLVRRVTQMKNGENTELGQFLSIFISNAMNTDVGLFDLDSIKGSFQLGENITYSKIVEILIGTQKILRYNIKGNFLKAILADILPKKYQYFGLQKNKETNQYQIQNDDINDDIWYPIAIIDNMWMKLLQYPAIQQFLNGQSVDDYAINTTLEDRYWQQAFAAYLQGLKNLTEESLANIGIVRV